MPAQSNCICTLDTEGLPYEELYRFMDEPLATAMDNLPGVD